MELRIAQIDRIARRAGILLCGLLLLAGCTQQAQPPRQLMAIPPVRVKIKSLNARAALLTKLRLTGDVNLTLTNHDGSTSSYQAHAVLLVDQNRVAHFLLVGTYLGQDAFEMGMNRRIYWLIDHEHKIAYVGRVDRESLLPSGVMPLRPQRILDMLGITPVILGGATRVAMFNVPRADRYNLLLMHSGGGGLDHIERQISISRYTGQISRVRLYDRNGRAIAYADLSGYHPLGQAFRGVEVPLHIVINCLDARAKMDMRVQHATMKLPGKSQFIFASPSFQGLNVVDIDRPANWVPAPPSGAAAK